MKRLVIIFSLLIFGYFDVKAQTKWNLYGGKNYDQYLGCLDCATDNLNSIWCEFSDYGSTHHALSIWNEVGVYGSKTSDFSPFNEKAKYPPLIINQNGKSLGYFTINKKFPNRSRLSLPNSISERRDEIVKDIPKYYTRIFNH
jgi:hypothetical protein